MYVWMYGYVCVVEILQHPWLKLEDENVSASTDTMGTLPSPQKTSHKHSSTNLTNALRKLSDHVIDRKMEKMATGFTRLVFSMQQGM